MENYGMFFAGMLAMALVGLIALLIIRPWLLRPMRHDREASHEVIAENSRLAAAQVRRQTAEEQDRAIQAGITAEQTRARLIEAQAENDQLEIERRETLKQAGIDPDEPPPCQQPKNWFGKHKFWILFTLFWVSMIIIAMLYDKGVIR